MAKKIIPFERHEGGVTPGAAYNIGFFYDANHRPCNKEDAVEIHIHEYDKDDNFLQETLMISDKYRRNIFDEIFGAE